MTVFIADIRLAALLLLRSRLWVVAGIMVILLAACAWLSAQFSPRQPATVALDIGLSFIRVAVPFWFLLQTQDLLAREIDRRLILTSLTYPRSRTSFVLARYFAIVLVTLGLTALLFIVLAGIVDLSGQDYDQVTKVSLGVPYLVTFFFLILDFAVVTAFAVMLSTISTIPNLVFLAGFGFMIAARSASTIIQLLERENQLVKGAHWYHQGLQGMQWAMPDLAALDVRPIALYNKMELLPQAPWALVVMALAYVAVLLTVACLRFERRQFT